MTSKKLRESESLQRKRRPFDSAQDIYEGVGGVKRHE